MFEKRKEEEEKRRTDLKNLGSLDLYIFLEKERKKLKDGKRESGA